MCFPFSRQDGQDEMKNKQTILVTSLPKTTKNEDTKMGWNTHKRLNVLITDGVDEILLVQKKINEKVYILLVLKRYTLLPTFK